MDTKDVEKSHDENSKSDEIEIAEIVSVLWQGKISIVLLTGLFAVISVAYALWLPNIYESKAVLAPKQSTSSGLAGLASQYGGLASLAGINLGGMGAEASETSIALETINSFAFFETYLFEDIVPELMAAKLWNSESNTLEYDQEIYDAVKSDWVKQESYPYMGKPSAQESYLKFKGIFSLEEDLKTGMITLRVKHLSPDIAKRWLDLIIRSINTSLRTSDVEEAKASIDFLNDQRTKTNLVSLDQVFAQLIEEQTKTIMLAHVSEDYVFKVIDPPISPEIKTEPKRAIICIVGTLLGGVISVLLVFGRTFITKESFGFK